MSHRPAPAIGITRCVGVVIAGGLLGITSAFAKTDYVYGPPPDWSRYVELGTAAIRAALPDADTWQILWPNGYKQAAWWPGGTERGYLSCGVVRAMKPIDGGYPSRPFIVVIDQDRVKKLDYRPNGHSLVVKACDALVRQGLLPPASLMPTAETVAIASLGITIRPTVEGARITAVTSGSPAATAGLTPAIIIVKANGIALAGMGSAMAKLLASDPPVLTLDTADRRSIVIKRPR